MGGGLNWQRQGLGNTATRWPRAACAFLPAEHTLPARPRCRPPAQLFAGGRALKGDEVESDEGEEEEEESDAEDDGEGSSGSELGSDEEEGDELSDDDEEVSGGRGVE